MFAVLVIAIIFLASLCLTLWRGVAATFTYVLLPVVLVIYNLRPLEIRGLPDVTTTAAVSYGVLTALALRGWERPFNLHAIDLLVLALSLHQIVSGIINEYIWTGVSTLGNQVLGTLVPYFMGRAVFVDRYWRLRSAMVIVALAIPIALISLIEMRLYPLFFSRFVLRPFGLTSVAWEEVLRRFGLFRAQATFSHPIDLGNGGALMLCLLTALACTMGRRLTTPWVAAGVAAGGIMIAASMSFTSYVAVAAIAGLYVMLRYVRYSAYLLVPIAVAAIIGYSGLTMHFVETPLEQPDYEDVEGGQYEGSYYIRHLIVKSVWPGVREAGFFGYGGTWSSRDYGLLSIDNAYMLFILDDGWGFLALFLLMAVVLCFYATRALVRIEHSPSRTALAAAVGGIIGTMLGMYTVFFGYIYATLFIMLLGVSVSMCQEVFQRTGEAEPRRRADGTAFGTPDPAVG